MEAANEDLAHLDSMTFGAVSFEELLGHCGEALNVYARHADAIESRLASFGYESPSNSTDPLRLHFVSQALHFCMHFCSVWFAI